MSHTHTVAVAAVYPVLELVCHVCGAANIPAPDGATPETKFLAICDGNGETGADYPELVLMPQPC